MRFRDIVARWKDDLCQEFDGRCGYCETTLVMPEGADIDNFYPQSQFPERAGKWSNFVLACHPCIRAKADKFPLAPDGTPLLLDPRSDSYDQHIRISENGVATALTERGAVTIDVLQLNRAELAERRRLAIATEAYFRDYDEHLPNPPQVFRQSLTTIRAIAANSGPRADEVQYLRNLLYANVIGALEAYLSDTLISAVTRDEKSLRRFVETFLDFKKERFELRDVFQRRDNIREHSVKALREVIFHDLPKIAGIYRDALNVQFSPFGDLQSAVFIRHDIVHRNGKNKDGMRHKIGADELEKLCVAAQALVEVIEKQLVATRAQSGA